MAGLFDFIKTPEGQGLLGALAGYAATANSRTPVNSLGRGALAGMAAYGNANQRQEELAYKNLQMDSLREQIEASKRKNTLINGILSGQQPDQSDQPAPFNPVEQSLSMGAAAGSVGPTMENASRLNTMPTSAPAPARPQSTGFLSSLTPDKLAALKLGAGIDLTDTYKLTMPNWVNVNGNMVNTNDPAFKGGFVPQIQASQDGQVTMIEPDGRGGVSARAAPGAIETYTAFQEARQRAEAQNKLLPLDYVTPDGRPIGGSVGSYLNSQPMRNRSGGTLSPELSEFIRQDAARNGITNPVANFTGGGPNAVYGMASGQNSAPPILQSKPEAEAAAITAKTPVEVDREAKIAAQKQISEQRGQIMSAGFNAPANIAKYQKIGTLLSDVDGGKFTPVGTEFASALNGLGIKVDKNLPNKEAAAAFANQAALELRNPSGGAGMPGAMSDADRNFLASMTPSSMQSAAGRKMVIDSYIAIQQRNQQVADFARKYEAKYGKLDNGFFDQLSAWSAANPLFKGK